MENEIDQKDLKILEILKENSQLTTRQIAKKTLIPPTTINNRIKKLKKEKIITKYTIEVDHEKLNQDFVIYILISVNLTILKEKKKTQHDIVNKLRSIGFIERADIVSGGTDIIAIIRVKDVKEFDRVLLEKIQVIDGIENTQSLIRIH